VLYVELISPNDTLISRQTLKLSAGTAAGDIPLATTLQQGVYRIRAYTKWMRNAGPAYFYDHKIRIGGILAPFAAANKQIAPKPDIQFFPEGGDMVVGVRSRVALKAINGNGLGEDIKGVIEDNAGNVVADFATQHLGMGVFAIIPQGGKTYRAKIIRAGESVYTVDLPPAKEQGYTLAVNNSRSDSLFIKVAISDALLKQKQGSAFYLLAQSAGKIYYSATAVLNTPAFGAAISKSRFPSGILQVTLFDDKNQPVAERIAFIQGSDSLTLKLSTPSGVYKTRQPVKFSLDAAANGKPANGTFSVAVINETVSGADDASESTILNNLLLTSDLKGNVEQPNYYFGNNSQAKADLDVLMLTQGYRRFDWGRALSDTPAGILFEPEAALGIEGLLKTATGKIVANGKISLISTRDNIVADTVTNAAGEFKFNGLELSDTSKVILRARNGKNGNNINLYLRQPAYPAINGSANINNNGVLFTAEPVIKMPELIKAGQDYVLKQKQDSLKNGRLLNQVNIRARALKPEAPSVYNRFGAATPDFQISGKDLGTSNLSMGLQLNLRFVSYKNGKFTSTKQPFKRYHIVIDGVEVAPDQINMYAPEDIDNVKMSDLSAGVDKAIYGIMDTPEIDGGLIIITTKMHAGTLDSSPRSKPKEVMLADSNKYLTNNPPSGFFAYTFKGFTPLRTFYSPKYSAASPLPDTRSTIYWNPELITDAQGNATFEYLNNDSKGTYRVVIEGIDADGNIGRQVYRYKVE
jgi:hypothetical protein